MRPDFKIREFIYRNVRWWIPKHAQHLRAFGP